MHKQTSKWDIDGFNLPVNLKKKKESIVDIIITMYCDFIVYNISEIRSVVTDLATKKERGLKR